MACNDKETNPSDSNTYYSESNFSYLCWLLHATLIVLLTEESRRIVTLVSESTSLYENSALIARSNVYCINSSLKIHDENNLFVYVNSGDMI